MSLTFSFHGRCDQLTANYNPPIKLDQNIRYCIGLSKFFAYNTIPNIVDRKFYYGNLTIKIPTGYYDIGNLEEFLQIKLGGADKISISPDNTNLKTKLKCSYSVDFTKPDSIGDILGFGKVVLNSGREHTSIKTANFIKSNNIKVQCNIVSGSYHNSSHSHIIHEFPIQSPIGSPIIDNQRDIIYLPLNTTTINNITLTLLDQDNELVDFQDEPIQITLHLKEWGLLSIVQDPSSIKKLHHH